MDLSIDTAATIGIPLSWALAIPNGTDTIHGATPGRATGYTATSAAANKAIMATAYTPQSANAQRSLASASAADTGAGAGAQQVVVTYLDAAFAVHVETVTLSGTTPVNMVATDVCYLESLVVTRVGSNLVNAGVISIYTATAGGGSVFGSIAAPLGVGDLQTFWGHHYVPAGVTCYVVSLEGGSFTTGGTLFLARTGSPSATNLPLTQIGPTIIHPAGNQSEHQFQVPLAIPGPDRIVLYTRPLLLTGDTSMGNFEYVQW